MTASSFGLLLLFVDCAVALVVAWFASRRDWTAWRDPRHSERMPMAESAWTWFLVCAVVLPIGLLAYALDRRRAPLLRAVEPSGDQREARATA